MVSEPNTNGPADAPTASRKAKPAAHDPAPKLINAKNTVQASMVWPLDKVIVGLNQFEKDDE